MSNSWLGLEEVKDYKTITKQLFAEFLGTFLYLAVVLVAGTTIQFSVITTALCNGLVFTSILLIIGRVSGGHLNPAITVGALCYGRQKIIKSVLYIIVQILGGILGSIVAYYLTVSSSRGNLGAILPLEELRYVHIFGLEFITTFILVSVFLSVNNETDRRYWPAAFAIGLCITGCQCAAFTYTACLNPVRALGPALVMNLWKHHCSYWVGPLLAGIVAGFLYKYVLQPKPVIPVEE